MNTHQRRTDVLRRARENLARYGWIQGVIGSRRHGYCASGAIKAATRSKVLQMLARSELRTTLGYNWDGDIVDWNDEPKRTTKQVIRAFDKTIKRLEKEAVAK